LEPKLQLTLREHKKDEVTWLFQLAVAARSKYFLELGFAHRELKAFRQKPWHFRK